VVVAVDVARARAVALELLLRNVQPLQVLAMKKVKLQHLNLRKSNLRDPPHHPVLTNL
jgi:hypothetical protein